METPDYERKKKKKKHPVVEPEIGDETPKKKKKKLLDSYLSPLINRTNERGEPESPWQKSPKKKNTDENSGQKVFSPQNKLNDSGNMSDDDTFVDATPFKNKKHDGETMKSPKKMKSLKDNMKVEEEEQEEEIDEMYDENEDVENQDDVPGVAEDGSEMFMGWEKSELVRLFDQMKAQIPKNDAMSFMSRAKKIDWKKVAFDDKTEEECQKVWASVQIKMRKFRLLDEVLQDARNWADTPWRNLGHGKKIMNHPDMPKKPLSAYFIFLKAKQQKYKARYPELSMVQMTKLMGQKYKELSDDRKSKYIQKAESLKAEYAKKLEQFKKDHPSAAKAFSKPITAKKEKSTRNAVKPKRPKPPLTPFKLFVISQLGEYKQDKSEELKEAWKKLSERKKVPFIKKALEEEDSYQDYLKEFFAENPGVGAKKLKPVISKEERRILDKAEGKPEDPPTSSFMLYKKIMLNDPQMKEKFPATKDRLKEIGQLWHSVSEDEKQQYTNQVKKMREEFVMQYKKYLDTLPEEKRLLELAQGKLKRVHALDEFSSGGKILKQKTISEMLEKSKPGKSKSEAIKPKEEEEEEEEEEDDEEEEEDDQFVSDYESGEESEDDVDEIKEKIIAKEPPPPPSNPFEYFKSTVKEKIQSEKKQKKLWDRMNPHDKLKYKQKLAEVKQRYLLEYRIFLKSLNEKEIAVLNDIKKNRTGDKVQNESSDNDNEIEEDKTVSVPKKKNVPTQKKVKLAPPPSSSEDDDSS